MKYLFAAVLVASSFAGFSAANAAGGCGAGWHRGPYGGCQPNRGGVVVVSAGPGRRGAARPPLPLRLGLALRPLPPVLTACIATEGKTPLHAGFLLGGLPALPADQRDARRIRSNAQYSSTRQ